MAWDDSHKDLGERVATFLRQRHPQKTAAEVAAETGLGIHRISAWIEHRSSPDGAAFLALVAAYGPEFLEAAMPQHFEWISASARQAELDRLAQEKAELQRRIDNLNDQARVARGG